MKLAKLQKTKPTIRFSSKLIRSKPNEKTGSWTLTLPKRASAKLPSRGKTMVEGTINGFPFRAALEPNRKGSHCLMVNKTMRDGAGADGMDTVTVELTRTAEEPDIRVPMDLRRALAAAPRAQAGWEDITPTATGLDLLNMLSQAVRNPPAPDQESVRHACLWKATAMLFSRYKVAYERKRRFVRDVASAITLRKIAPRRRASLDERGSPAF